nr:replicative DNA helicase [Halorhodospira halophila]
MEAEQAVLGGLMLDNAAWDQVADRLHEEDFYRREHRLVYRAMGELAEGNHPMDVVTLSGWLRQQGKLEEAGGLSYLGGIARETPSAANIRAYADIVRERSVLRQLIRAGSDVAEAAFRPQGRNSEDLLDYAEQTIFQIAEQTGRNRQGFVGMRQLMPQVIDRIDTLYHTQEAVTGLATGFDDLDHMTSGLQDGDLVIVAGRPSMGKCLAYDAEIVQADGGVKTIEQIVRERRAHLATVGADWRLTWTEPCDYVDDGHKPVFEVTTRLGRRIETTLTHPFLTVHGWQRLEDLAEGDAIGVPRQLPVFGQEPIRDCEVRLLGHLIGDGGLTGSPPRLTSGQEAMTADFLEAVDAFGGVEAKPIRASRRTQSWVVVGAAQARAAARSSFASLVDALIRRSPLTGRAIARNLGVAPATLTYWRQGVNVPDAAMVGLLAGELGVDVGELRPEPVARRNDRNPLQAWLDRLGLAGKSAHEKTVPDCVFRLPREQLARFLNRLFSSDGWVTHLASGQGQIGYTTVSEALARQIQHLLLRFGVLAKLRHRSVRYQDGRRPAWQLDITHAESILTFAEQIGILGKEQRLASVAASVRGRRRQSHTDHIPCEIWQFIDRARGEWTWAELARRAGVASSNIHAYRRGMSRQRLAAFADALGSRELRQLASSDLYWDRIASIRPLGHKQVYDLTIPETHNFIANDVCVHNTTVAMNMVEHVAMQLKKPVAVFSMEMPADALAMRMLASLGRVHLQRVRSGKLQDDDWPRLTSTMSLLAEAPLFIDDSPGLTPTEIRARARRLQREHDELGLIVIDYLQLMQIPGFRENRAGELSEISRGLKALAKELNTPVIALSQLNRSLEQRPNKRPIMSDLRECVTGDTLVLLADGQRRPISELVGSAPEVIAIDDRHRLVPAQAERVWRVGRRPVYRVQLASGRLLRATARHRLLTGSGWKRVDELRDEDRIAIARTVPEPGSVMESESDVFWDHLVAVEPDGEEDVYDLTVPGPASWVADSIISHNSGAIEQDADLIAFIYRDEVYNEDTPDKGVAELIIAKQRQGPIGTVKLTFLGEYTRFENYIEDVYGGGIPG